MAIEPDPTDVEVGRRLREMRKARRMTLPQLGGAVDLTYQQMAKYETGANRISASMLWRIAGVLGVGVERFFGDTDPETDATAAAAQAVGRLEPRIRTALCAVIEAIAASYAGSAQSEL